jgi:DNA-binding MarR family transcriptional regulator
MMINEAASPELKCNTTTEIVNLDSLLIRYLDNAVKQTNYNREYGRLLLALAKYGPMTQSALGEMLLFSPERTTITIDKLEHEGLLKRKIFSKDRRVKKVTITKKGQRWIHQNIDPVPNILINAIPSEITNEELEVFNKVLFKIRDYLIKLNNIDSEINARNRFKLEDFNKFRDIEPDESHKDLSDNSVL